MWPGPFEQTFVSLSHARLHMKFGFNQFSSSKEKMFENVESEWPCTKVSKWPWPLIFIEIHVLIYLNASPNFDIIDYNSFWKIHCFTFIPFKSIRDQTWPSPKIGQGQPRVIVWILFVVFEHPMSHNKFQGHRLFGSGEEDFLKVITI